MALAEIYSKFTTFAPMLYIHIPICASKCHYCSFYSVSQRGASTKELTDGLCQELEERRAEHLEPLRTIYFGGGTPSVLSLEELSRVIDAIHRNYDTTNIQEFTLEANIEHLTDEYLRGLRDLGVDRLSFGIQSFNDKRLEMIGRKHSAQDAKDAVARAVAAGFSNISVDLMFGFGDLSIDEWRESVRCALELGVQHISAYQLSIEPGTLFARRGVECASDEECFMQYLLLCEELKRAGYEHYEISNFALNGYRSKHNSSYWIGRKYLGIGPSAHSYDGQRCRSWNISSLREYLGGVEAEREYLSSDDLHNEFLMTRLRTVDGFTASEYRARFGREFIAVAGVERSGDSFFIPEDKLFTADAIICDYFI